MNPGAPLTAATIVAIVGPARMTSPFDFEFGLIVGNFPCIFKVPPTSLETIMVVQFRRLFMSAVLVLLAGAAIAPILGGQAGREFALCIRGCVHARMDCVEQCREECSGINPGGRGQCMSECRQICSEEERTCKEDCQAIKDGQTPEDP